MQLPRKMKSNMSDYSNKYKSPGGTQGAFSDKVAPDIDGFHWWINVMFKL